MSHFLTFSNRGGAIPLGSRLPKVTYPELAVRYRLRRYEPYAAKFPANFLMVYLLSFYLTICVTREFLPKSKESLSYTFRSVFFLIFKLLFFLCLHYIVILVSFNPLWNCSFSLYWFIFVTLFQLKQFH